MIVSRRLQGVKRRLAGSARSGCVRRRPSALPHRGRANRHASLSRAATIHQARVTAAQSSELSPGAPHAHDRDGACFARSRRSTSPVWTRWARGRWQMTEDTWSYVQDSKRQGPVSVDKLRTLLQAGSISPSTLVWRPGLETWLEAAGVQELRPYVPPPVPSSAPLQPPARPATARSPGVRFGLEGVSHRGTLPRSPCQ
jgi:hypothetical protein